MIDTLFLFIHHEFVEEEVPADDDGDDDDFGEVGDDVQIVYHKINGNCGEKVIPTRENKKTNCFFVDRAVATIFK